MNTKMHAITSAIALDVQICF